MKTETVVKHTPGPWIYSGDKDGDFCIWGPGRDEFIANIDQESFGPLPPCKVAFDVNQANGRLIAAAPDLLEACERMLGREYWTTHKDDCDCPTCEAYKHLSGSSAAKRVIAAIRKAKGE